MRAYPSADVARLALRRGEVDLLFGDAISLAFWLNGTDSENCCAFRGGPYIDSRYFGEGIGIAVKQGQRYDAAGAELGVVPGVGAGPFHRSVAALFPDQPVLIAARCGPARSEFMSTIEAHAALREIAENSNAWPFEEARKIVARLKKQPKDEVIFETGYGPSGLPHIGTFGEVARTTMVRHAFRVLTEDKIKTRLIAFSDDMDGLRKVPDNVPEPGHDGAASRQAAVARARPVLERVSVVRRRTTMRGCARSSISSASSTSFCRRPSATRPAASTPRC